MLKRFTIFILLLSLCVFPSCEQKESADIILRNFCAAYPFSTGQIYSSEEKESSPYFLTEEMLSTLYGEGERPLYSSGAVLLFADMDTIFECGIFVVRGGAGKLYDITRTETMFGGRIRQITRVFPMAEGKMMRYGNVVTYVVTSDNERAEKILSRLL